MLPVQFDDVNGKRLRYFRGGKGPTIVFLHGYPDNLQMWSGVIPLLPDFEAIAFDWPGMGGSEAWVGGATPFAMADRLIALLDHWHVNRAAVVGIDMGGQPAAVAAARNPDRVSYLIISGSLLQWNVGTSWEIALLRRFRFNQFAIRNFPRMVFRRAVSTSIPHLADDIRDDFWVHFRRPCRGFRKRSRCRRSAFGAPTTAISRLRTHCPAQSSKSLKTVSTGFRCRSRRSSSFICGAPSALQLFLIERCTSVITTRRF
ncbi:MAG: hypothetical protein DMF58_18665 [Acidobacteria bacterium]|nr:MAG: hypothetical protein DMF58_18665 [Acidobacteriota bacterium]